MNTEMRRNLVRPLVSGLFACLLGSSAFAALAATEVEPNDAISRAQLTPVPAGGLSIPARIGVVEDDLTTDLDFFTFDATEGDTPSISIVGALQPDGAGECSGFPANLALYDSAGNLLAGDISECEASREARIDKTTLPATGRYTIAVSAYTHYFLAGGDVENADMPTPGGTYQLVVGGVRDPSSTTPPPPPPPASAKRVPIEIRHWHQDERDLGRRGGMWPIAVAILSVKGFDATTIDPNSLTFGATGNETSLFRCVKNGVDINRDRRLDSVCYFKPDVANFHTGDLNGILKGKTKSGQQIEGSAALKIFSVPKERRGFKHRRHHGNGHNKR